MAGVGAFWSYAHADDKAEGGRISQLARDVVSQYEMITGESINLFLDRDDLEWGDDWKSKIDSSLSSVAFFIAILTPRYFQSTECRRELNFFARRATELGMKDLILPILYVNVPALSDDASADPLFDLANTFQRQNWTNLRFNSPDSHEYRSSVAQLAERLAVASTVAESVASAPTSIATADSDDDTPGFVDLVANAEHALPIWAENLDKLGEQITVISSLFEETGKKIQAGNAQGKGMSARVLAFGELAEKLDRPAGEIEELGGQFTKLLQEVDLGVIALLNIIPTEIKQGDTDFASIENFLNSISDLAMASEDGLGMLDRLVGEIEPAEKNSRSLRPPMRRLRKALTLVSDGRDVMRNWTRKIDEIDLSKETD